MPLVCPNCKRTIVSFNFKYCLYCSVPFNEEFLQEFEKEKETVKSQSFDKDFVEWKFKSNAEKEPETRFIKFVKLFVIMVLLSFTAGLFYTIIMAFQAAGESGGNRYSSFLLFISAPILFAMLVIIGFMIYKMFKRK
jgi:hypothetical protein